MALPEAHAEPAVQEGVCYALFAYDAGLAINLDESERRITALTQRAAIRHKRRAPRYFEYRPAPLRVTQEREVLAVGAFRTAPSVDAVLYDFGAVSVTYQIPLAGPLTRLITLAEELYESDVLRAGSRRWVESLLAAIAPAVTRPGLTDFVETYVIFEICAFTPPCAPAALYTTYGQEVARILRSERAALSDQEVDDAVGHRISFGSEDVTLIDWDAALIADRDAEDVRAVLEFANVELLEMRYLDQQLDDALAGLRALDLTDALGYLCGRLLADLGALVIKVEPPGGDRGRALAPRYRARDGREHGLYWHAMNAGKLGVTLALEHPEAPRVLADLAARVDFVLDSFPPEGAAARLVAEIAARQPAPVHP